MSKDNRWPHLERTREYLIEKNYTFKISNATNILINKVDFCTKTPNHQSKYPQNHQDNNNNNENNQAELKEDLREIPYLNSFYGRSEELTNLIRKILEKKQSRYIIPIIAHYY